MPSASTSQSGSTKLHSLNVQRHVLNGLGAAGVEWGGLTETKSEKGLHGLSRPEGSHGLSHEVGPEEWRDWEQALWASDGPSSSQPDHPLLLASQTALRLFIAIDVKLSEEAAWTEPLMNLLRAVVDSVGVRQSAIVSNLERDTSQAVLNVLGYPALRKVKPDFFMGIQTSSLRIALDLSTPAESVDPSDYLSKREGLGFLWEISQFANPDHVFSWMFAELKGPLGGTGEGRIQNTVACFLALNIHFHLARLARQADPVSFRPPTDTMRRVYGLQTLCGVCKVLVMVGSPEQLKSKSKGRTGIADDPGRGQAHAEGSAAGQNAEQGTSGESDAEDPLDLKSLTVSTLWTGNLLDPSSLITLIPLLQIITAQTLERLNLIGNWLYCLRDRLPDINPKPKRAVSAPSRASRAKRPRADERGRRIARGQLPIAPGREQPPTPQADRAPQSGLSQQATNFKRYVLGLKLIRGNRPFIVGDREKFSILGHQLGDMPQLDPDLRVKEWVREVIS